MNGMFVWALALGSSAISVSCASEGFGKVDDDGVELGVTASSIIGGRESTMIGVVFLSTAGHDCSGVVINDVTILTAAHCVGAAGPATVSAIYKTPSNNFICLTGGNVLNASGSPPHCETPGSFTVTRGPDSEVANDYAVLVADDYFKGVSASDFAFIDVGSLTDVERVGQYGYGSNSESGGHGVLRQGSGELDERNDSGFVVQGGDTRLCAGDSGGPATIPISQTAPNLLVLGLWSRSDRDGLCTPSGNDQAYVRLRDKMDVIRTAMGSTGPYAVLGKPECTALQAGKSRRSAMDCVSLYW